MTREKAKEELILSLTDNHIPDPEAVEKAIKALDQETCEDCISRREAIKKFTYNYKGERIPDYDCDNFPVQIDIKTVKEMLRELPPVTPQPKTGHWINIDATHSKCDRCEAVFEIVSENGEVNYCPNCGAKMEEVEE